MFHLDVGNKGQAPCLDDSTTTIPQRGRGEGIEDTDVVILEEGRVSLTGLEGQRFPRQVLQRQHGPVCAAQSACPAEMGKGLFL